MTDPTTDRPTQPGWYWVRKPGIATPEGDEWDCVRILPKSGHLVVCLIDTDDVLDLFSMGWDGDEWLGPITPDDMAIPIRLQAAGDALAEAAKAATVALDGPDDVAIRARLCDAIGEWLGACLGEMATDG